MEAAAGTTFESTKSRPLADFLYETFYGGAIGGSILALFFLAVDTLAGQPLFTPSREALHKYGGPRCGRHGLGS
jgi:hypothetical protein